MQHGERSPWLPVVKNVSDQPPDLARLVLGHVTAWQAQIPRSEATWLFRSCSPAQYDRGCNAPKYRRPVGCAECSMKRSKPGLCRCSLNDLFQIGSTSVRRRMPARSTLVESDMSKGPLFRRRRQALEVEHFAFLGVLSILNRRCDHRADRCLNGQRRQSIRLCVTRSPSMRNGAMSHGSPAYFVNIRAIFEVVFSELVGNRPSVRRVPYIGTSRCFR